MKYLITTLVLLCSCSNDIEQPIVTKGVCEPDSTSEEGLSFTIEVDTTYTEHNDTITFGI